MSELLTLVSSMATREVLAELLRDYQSAGGHPVQATAAGGVEVAKRVRGGEAVDMVVLAESAIDALIEDGSALPGRVDIASSGIAVAVPASAPRPAIDSEAALRLAVERAASLSYSTGPSGVYLEQLFARWGLLETLRARIVVPPPGVPVGALLARGDVALGFQQLPELLTLPGIEVLGPLPPPLQSITVFSGAVTARCAHADAARAVLRYLAAPAAAEVKRRFGMQPG